MTAKDEFNKLSPHCVNGPDVIEGIKYTTHTNRA
jgi:hypothetical protein